MMQQMRSRTAIVGALLLLGILSAPLLVGAAPAKSTGPFRYAVWTPYWRKTAGVAETQAHLMQLHEISPFGYTLTADGTIVDSMQLGKAPWPELLARATSSKVTVLPSITSGEGNVLHALLKDRVRRAAHVAAIMKIVGDNSFDGIDIDYEAKLAETRPYFSAFIRELASALHAKKKHLSCTIEPRTPLNSLYYVPPTGPIERANDYAVLNRYCDQIRLMTYEYEIDPIGGRLNNYKIVRSWSYTDAYALAAKVGTTPKRNKAGELSFTYATSTSILKKNQATSTTATTTPKMYTRLVWFTDAQSIGNIITLAKSYNLRGVAIFKLDGAADPAMWQKIK